MPCLTPWDRRDGMAIFNDAVITNAGKEIIAKVIKERGTIQFTGIADRKSVV